jgi:hypothetical protein
MLSLYVAPFRDVFRFGPLSPAELALSLLAGAAGLAVLAASTGSGATSPSVPPFAAAAPIDLHLQNGQTLVDEYLDGMPVSALEIESAPGRAGQVLVEHALQHSSLHTSLIRIEDRSRDPRYACPSAV